MRYDQSPDIHVLSVERSGESEFIAEVQVMDIRRSIRFKILHLGMMVPDAEYARFYGKMPFVADYVCQIVARVARGEDVSFPAWAGRVPVEWKREWHL